MFAGMGEAVKDGIRDLGFGIGEKRAVASRIPNPESPIPVSGAAACLYPARVMHQRHIAPLYRFVYRVFYVLVDVDRLDELHARHRFFSRNRFNLLSLHDRDHGDGRGLRIWAERILKAGGIDLHGGRIRLLAMPRVLGMAFNPISLWYCDDRKGIPRAVIAEVNNTFGEKHSYLLTSGLASGAGPFSYEQVYEKDKVFHVSPFLPVAGQYQFRLTPPGASLACGIFERRDGARVVDATLTAQALELTDGAMLKQVLRLPWQMLKVVLGIHWEALKIWLRGGRFHPSPAPPQEMS